MKILGLFLSLFLTTSLFAGEINLPVNMFECVGSVNPETGETLDCDFAKDSMKFFRVNHYYTATNISFIDKKELNINLRNKDHFHFDYKIRLKYIFKSNADLAKKIIEEEAIAIYIPKDFDSIKLSDSSNLKRVIFIMQKNQKIVRLYDLIDERN